MIDIYKILLPLATDDYQNRCGNYPESDEADTIQVSIDSIVFDFKNTSINSAKRWVYRFLKDNDLDVDENDINAWQDGEYTDDWVMASVSLRNIKKLK